MPAERAVELALLSKIQKHFALHGFEDVQHRSVEPVPVLLSKGETSKEVYLLSRLQDAFEAEGGTVNLRERLESRKQLGLHFDLTVPFARYVLDASAQLHFPFRRSSVGKVWRGERPQAGRFREFVQADVDIVAEQSNGMSALEALGVFNDVEVVKVVLEALQALEEMGVPKVLIQVNNRKLLQGCYAALGVKNFEKTLQALDKLPKLGASAVRDLLVEAGEEAEIIAQCLALAAIEGDAQALRTNALLQSLTSQSALAEEGYSELLYLLESVDSPQCLANLSITRGLDYYTGSVFETFISGLESYGSIASGGRYDNLTSTLGVATKVNYPGVGMSIGVSRLLAIGFEQGFFALDGYAPAQVLVAVNDADARMQSDRAASVLRQNGIATIVSPNHAKFGKQIDFASKRGIKYVLFLDENAFRIKNIVTGEQRDLSTLTDFSHEELF